MQKRATAEDVARAAGVSRATVSRAFTPSAYVAEKTRAKIKEAADKLGYRRNALARALIKNESDLVAIVTGQIKNMYDARVFDALTSRLQESQKWGLLVHANDDEVDRLLNEAMSYPVQAVIVRSGSVDAKTIAQCGRLGVPLILTGTEYSEFEADSVCCDNVLGARMAVETLVQRGAKRIAYLGGAPNLYSDMSRFKGFSEAMEQYGLTPAFIARGDFTFESGLEIGKKMLSGPDRPDAVFCCNDAMAIGMLNAASKFPGLSVPDDVAVIGFDDIPMAAWPCFELTTISNPVEPTVNAICEVLEHRLEFPESPRQTVRIKPKLMRRLTA